MPAGRPTSYKPEYAAQAEKLCALGATDQEIADFFEASVRTIHRWKLEFEDFCHALKSGKEPADDRAERSLYQKATGFTFLEQQAFKIRTVVYDNGKRQTETEKIEIVEVERYQAPDTTAAIFWLKNRRSDAWRDKRDIGFDELGDFSGAELRELSGAIRRLKAERVGEAGRDGASEETRH